MERTNKKVKIFNILKRFGVLFIFLITSELLGSSAGADQDLKLSLEMDGNWSDSSSNGNNGTAYNSANFSTVAIDGTHSGLFNGYIGQGYVNVGNSSSLDIKNALTAEAWIKTYGSEVPWMVPGLQVAVGRPGWSMGVHNGKMAVWFSIDGAADTIYEGGTINIGTWHHLAVTFDGTWRKYYIDGVNVYSSDLGNGPIQIYGNPDTIIGKHPSDAREYFNGLVDRVKIYNRALSAEEILASYQSADGIQNPDERLDTSVVVNPGIEDAIGSEWHCYRLYSWDYPTCGSSSEWRLSSPPAQQGTYSLGGVAAAYGWDTDEECCSWFGPTFKQSITIEPYTAYTLKAWVRDNSTARGVTIGLSGVGATCAATDAVSNVDTWTELTCTMPSSNTVTQKSIIFNWNVAPDNETDTFWIDNVRMYYTPIELPDTTAPVVTASPSGGTYTSAQSVSLSSNETATIYYTTDGTTPTTASAVYSSPISVSTTMTIKFFGVDVASNASSVQSETYTINPDLKLYLQMDGNWSDSSGNGNHGTAYNGATFSAVTIDGTHSGLFSGYSGQSYVDVGNPSSLDIRNALTVEAWIKTYGGTDLQFAVGRASAASSTYAAWYMGVHNGKMAVGFNIDGATDKFVEVGTLNIGTWHHLAVTFDGTWRKYYIDGVNVYSSDLGVGPVMINGGENPDTIIGKDPSFEPRKYFNGLIDNVKIYNRALSAEEILASYQSADGIQNPGERPTSLVINPSIENTIGSEWECYRLYSWDYLYCGSSSTWQLSSPSAQHGTYSLGGVAAAYGWDTDEECCSWFGPTFKQSITIEPYTAYTLKAWVRDNSTARGVTIGLSGVGATCAATDAVSNVDTWTELTCTMPSSNTVTQKSIIFNWNVIPDNYTDTFWVDNIRVYYIVP